MVVTGRRFRGLDPGREAGRGLLLDFRDDARAPLVVVRDRPPEPPCRPGRPRPPGAAGSGGRPTSGPSGSGAGGPSSPRISPSRSWPPSAASPRSGPRPPWPSSQPSATSSNSRPSESSWPPPSRPSRSRPRPWPSSAPGSGLLTKRKRVPIPRRILVLACESPLPGPHRHHPRRLPPLLAGTSPRASPSPGGSPAPGSPPASASRSGPSNRLKSTWWAWAGFNARGTSPASASDSSSIPSGTASRPRTRRRNPGRKGQGGHHQRTVDGTNSAGVIAPGGTNSAGFSLTRESLPSEETKDQRESRGEDAPSPVLVFSIPESEREKTQDHPLGAPSAAALPHPARGFRGRRPGPGAAPPGGQVLAHARRRGALAAPLDDRHREGPDGRGQEPGRALPVHRRRTGNGITSARGTRRPPGSGSRPTSGRNGPPAAPGPRMLGHEGHAGGGAAAAPALDRCHHPEDIRNRGIRDLDQAYPSLRTAGWDRPRFVAAVRALAELG